jgi:ATP-dependent Clp protease ATP-binding subunit ClpC
MTGIPLTRMRSDEAERLLELEKELHKKVVSQKEAVEPSAKGVRRCAQRPEGSQAPDGQLHLRRPVRGG